MFSDFLELNLKLCLSNKGVGLSGDCVAFTNCPSPCEEGLELWQLCDMHSPWFLECINPTDKADIGAKKSSDQVGQTNRVQFK